MIAIQDGSGNLLYPADNKNINAYVLVSHGSDGKGAHNRIGNMQNACNASAKDGENCDSDSLFFDMPINDGDMVSTYFNDYIRWKPLTSINMDANSTNISTATGLPDCAAGETLISNGAGAYTCGSLATEGDDGITEFEGVKVIDQYIETPTGFSSTLPNPNASWLSCATDYKNKINLPSTYLPIENADTVNREIVYDLTTGPYKGVRYAAIIAHCSTQVGDTGWGMFCDARTIDVAAGIKFLGGNSELLMPPMTFPTKLSPPTILGLPTVDLFPRVLDIDYTPLCQAGTTLPGVDKESNNYAIPGFTASTLPHFDPYKVMIPIPRQAEKIYLKTYVNCYAKAKNTGNQQCIPTPRIMLQITLYK